jgi:hypothetical protein
MLPTLAQRVTVAVLFFAPVALTPLTIAPLREWLILRSAYSPEQIRQHDIRIKLVIRPHEAVYSNGERHDFGILPDLIFGVLFLAHGLVGAVMVGLYLHRVAADRSGDARKAG